MRVELDGKRLGSGCDGLEIGITGFEANPTDAENEPSQVFIEVYEGQSAGPCLGWTFPEPGHNANRSFTGEVTAANIALTTAERMC